MIKKLNIFLILLVIIVSSCKESVEPDTETKSSPAKSLVINELFRIDSAKYYSHWWLELYNPTDSSINIADWKIVFVNSNLTIKLNEQSAIQSLREEHFYS
jgi:hypothetical protein